MSYNITLNSTNLVGGPNNNQYQFNFINGGFNIPEGSEMCVNQITIPYSWVNISSALGNNIIGYSIPTGNNVLQFFQTTLPNGFYLVSDINNSLQALMKTNGHYWINTTTPYSVIIPQIIYPLTLSTYIPSYTSSVSTISIPLNGNIATQLGTGFTASGSWSGTYPTSVTTYNCASLFIPQTLVSPQSIGFMLGFTGSTSITSPATIAGSFYPTTQFISQSTSNVNGNSLLTNPPFPSLGSTVNGVVVRCNLANNSISNNSDTLDSFPITSSYGTNINYSPISGNWIKITSGRYSNIIVSFADQNFNPLIMLDPNVFISLLIRYP